jgi:hypothetical protein
MRLQLYFDITFSHHDLKIPYSIRNQIHSLVNVPKMNAFIHDISIKDLFDKMKDVNTWSFCRLIVVFTTTLYAFHTAIPTVEAVCSSICPTSIPYVTLPDVMLDAGFAGVLTQAQTCAKTEDLAQSGLYDEISCVMLRTSGIIIACGCNESDAAVPAPLPTPLFVPKLPPNVPIVPLTASAIAPQHVTMPTIEPADAMEAPNTPDPSFLEINAQVVLRLTTTPGPLTDAAVATFLEVCAKFYTVFLPGVVKNVTCSIYTDTRQLVEREQTIRSRSVTYYTRASLDVITEVLALFDPAGGVISFASELVQTVASRSDLFALRLRTDGNVESQVFFSTVLTVAAYDPLDVPPIPRPTTIAPAVPSQREIPTVPQRNIPTATAPVSNPVTHNNSSNRLSASSVVGIVIIVLVALYVSIKGL